MPEASTKNVLLRGVDGEAYGELSRAAKRMGVSVGYLASQAFKVFLALLDAGPQLAGFKGDLPGFIGRALAVEKRRKPVFIRHVGRLVLSREDLEKVDGSLFIFGVGELVFDPSVDTKLFEEKVLRIVDCGKVVIHRGLDKLAVLSKSLFIGEIQEVL
ncbi:hypothetical protein [Thermofilum pendens]|uniref:Uncharacterized protein n=1 Tax=Thermofilum pendens (strain DSM 2475 / Hrk 5) TaxID=368408 RepID=A1S138_THEPD|nr:hypothetical protein [Thermofilum pendens]ABL79168.1 hypothetical protein Tpen_1773 [Thermofilum pendens Hrk 5]